LKLKKYRYKLALRRKSKLNATEKTNSAAVKLILAQLLIHTLVLLMTEIER
jgi:hypothetical protein